ncbi:MAG: aminotransferase class V-fold PLP-dependent enzyme [Flavobacteriales bacterium]|nr:aminotransferase class V-fold PLP-dependent enzyme [Flavobacteriales bacterium]
MTPIDVPLARKLTPGCAHVLHFNNAGASLMPDPVIAAVKDQLDLEARTGGYEAAFAMHERIEGKLVAITHVPSSGGLINPIEVVGAAVRGSNAIYLLDACQSVGQLPLDVDRIGCDLLSATGRKYLRGPRGTGFLYVRRSLLEKLEPPFMDAYSAQWTDMRTFQWRPDARRFEGFESSVANKLGLGAAVEHALGWGLDAIAARNALLADRLRQGLDQVPGVKVRDQGEQRSAIVTFTVEVPSLENLKLALHEHRMNISLVSLELARLDLEPRGITGMVRASVHYYNTEQEVDRFVGAVAEEVR